VLSLLAAFALLTHAECANAGGRNTAAISREGQWIHTLTERGRALCGAMAVLEEWDGPQRNTEDGAPKAYGD
jgi:hypothetical protein